MVQASRWVAGPRAGPYTSSTAAGERVRAIRVPGAAPRRSGPEGKYRDPSRAGRFSRAGTGVAYPGSYYATNGGQGPGPGVPRYHDGSLSSAPGPGCGPADRNGEQEAAMRNGVVGG